MTTGRIEQYPTSREQYLLYRRSSASQGEEAMEVVSENDIKQSTSKMSIGVTRSDR